MFFHNYKYRLKCALRDKQMLFWTFLFPVLMSTLFNMAFSNLESSEIFSKIKVGIVNNSEYSKSSNFIKAIEDVENSKKIKLFEVTFTDENKAVKLLNEDKIDGYIYYDNGNKLSVKESGINQTIIKEFLDDYKQTGSTIYTLASKNPVAISTSNMKDFTIRTDYMKEVPIGKAKPNTVLNYFYSLIGMACLYGSFWGLKEVTAIQANQSPQGSRLNVAPLHKLRLFIASACSAATIQLLEILVLLLYMGFVLKVNFGNEIGYILLTCFVGTIAGVTFGTCIASIIKKGEGVKVGILIGGSMLMSFLSGMMNQDIKYIVNTNLPILSYLNPVNLITDAFYSLYYYDTYTKFFINIGMLCLFSVGFSAITYFVLRRQKYASL